MQRNNVKYESAESDSQVIHSSGLLPELAASASAARPSESSTPSVQIQTSPGLPQPQQISRRVTGKQAPSEFEINIINSLKAFLKSMRSQSIAMKKNWRRTEEVDQELQLLQDLGLQEWYEGDLQGYSESEVKEAIKKELISLSSSGHEVYDPVPLKLLSREDRAKVIESRWVIGPRSGVLKVCNPDVALILVFRTQFGASAPKLHSPLKKQALAPMSCGCGPNNNPIVGFTAKVQKESLQALVGEDLIVAASHPTCNTSCQRLGVAMSTVASTASKMTSQTAHFEIFWFSLTPEVRGW